MAWLVRDGEVLAPRLSRTILWALFATLALAAGRGTGSTPSP
jgi:hypothetical protein